MKNPLERVASFVIAIRSSIGSAFRQNGSLVRKIILGVAVLVTFYITISPLVFLLWTSVWSSFPGDLEGSFTLENFTAYLDPSTYTLFFNSFAVAIGMVIVALTFGMLFAWLFARTNLPTKSYMEIVILLPYAIPGFIYAIVYIFIYGPRVGFATNFVMELFALQNIPWDIYSIWGIIVVFGINSTTSTYLILVPAMRNMDPALEETARIHGGNLWNMLRSVTFPVLIPAIFSAFLVMFIRGLGEFSIVAILGVPDQFHVFATKIWAAINLNSPPAYGYASALGISLLLILGILVWYYRKITARKQDFMTVTGSGYQPRQWDLGKWRWPIAGVLWMILIVFWVFPLLLMIIVSLHDVWIGDMLINFSELSVVHYIEILTSERVQRAFINSTVIGIIGAFLGTFIVTMTAYYTERTKMPFRGFVDILTLTPHAVPGIILGASTLFTYLWLDKFTGISLYGTIWIIIVGSVVVFLPTTSRIAVGNIVQIHDQLEESARVLGATWTGQMKEIFLPLYDKTVAIIFVYLFIHLFRLLSIPIITYTEETVTVSVIIFGVWRNSGQLERVAALATVFCGFMAVILLSLRLFGIKFYEI